MATTRTATTRSAARRSWRTTAAGRRCSPPAPYFPGVFQDVDWGGLRVAPPFLTYSDRVTLYSDDLRCEVRYVATPAHTTNDSIVWLPEPPSFSPATSSSTAARRSCHGWITGAIDVLEEVIKPLEPQTIVPGHGEVCGPEVIDDVLGYLHFVLDLARRGKDAGLSPLEAARDNGLGPHAGRNYPERIVGNLHRAYADAATASQASSSISGGGPVRHGCLQRRQAAQRPRLRTGKGAIPGSRRTRLRSRQRTAQRSGRDGRSGPTHRPSPTQRRRLRSGGTPERSICAICSGTPARDHRVLVLVEGELPEGDVPAEQSRQGGGDVVVGDRLRAG